MTSPGVFQNYSMRHEIPSCEAGLNFNHEAVSTPGFPDCSVLIFAGSSPECYQLFVLPA